VSHNQPAIKKPADEGGHDMTTRRWRHGFLISILLAWSATAAAAQGPTASISGTVRDQTGAVLPGVTIEVTNQATGRVRTAVTDAAGRYRIPSLESGAYTVQGTLTGFQTAVQRGVVLTVSSEVVVELTTDVGQIDENITVEGAVPLVQTTSAQLSGLVDDKEIRDLPLNGRSYEALAFLQPGVVQFNSASRGRTALVANGAGAKMSVAGTPGDFQSFLLDGTDIHDHAGFTPGSVAGNNLGVDAILEFRVLTHNYSAEYGRTAGGVVSAVTRSGTNALHGSAFEFFRDDALDAREFFDQGGTKPFRRNQFGAAIGGPIRRDRTFFFGNYEGLRQQLSQTLPRTVPTELARLGILPTPTINVSPLIRPYLALFPLPNARDFGDGTAEFLWVADTDVSEDFGSVRIDHQLTDRQSIFGRLTLDDTRSVHPGSVPPFEIDVNSRNTYLTLEHKSILSSRMVNVSRFAYNRTDPLVEDATPVDDSLRFVPGRMWLIQFQQGLSELGHMNGGLTRYTQDILQFSDDLDIQRGAHSMRLGINVERVQNTNAPSLDQAAYRFADLAALLQATPNRFQAATFDSSTSDARFRQWMIGYYFQDDVRFGDTLSLNLGLRHEFLTLPTEASGLQANIPSVATDTDVTYGPVFQENPSLQNIAPRVGFAWAPLGENRPVIRGGAGIYYNQIMGRLYYIAARSGFLKTAVITNPPFPSPGLETVATGSVSYNVWDPEPSTPTVYQYNVTVEQQFPSSVVATLSYAGSQGRNWVRNIAPNTPVPRFLDDGTPFYTGGPRINPAFGNIRQTVTDADATYNGIQVQVRRRESGGFAWQTSYTYSTAISEATAWGSAHTQNTPAIALIPFDRAADRSLSAFHVRHALAVNATYRLPGDSLTGLAGTLGRGWELSGILSAYSGTPFTVAVGFNRSADGNTDNPDRPSLKPGASSNPVVGTVEQWFDPTAFELPPTGFYGNLGRNTVIGPGLVNINLSIVKTFHPLDGHSLAFRTEFFNLLNHANFGSPNRIAFTSAGGYAANAGVIQTIATSSRQIQLGLRYSF
jgi:hypothetical protein